MGWLLELLFESVSEMCSKFIVDMMDVASGMFTEILSCDLDLFEELFGVAGYLYRNAVVPMGVALLLMILVWQLFKSMFGKLGTVSEDPVELVFRSCFCLFMILFAKDIVNYILEVAGTPYDWVVGTVITVDSFSEYVTAAEGVMSALGIDVMTISMLKLLLQLVVAWNYFKMLFILAERYVLLGIFSYTSPLAFAAGGSKATNNVLGSWTKMFGGQVLVVILDAWCVKMFLSAYGNMMASSYGFTKFFAANMCLIGFCKITAKLDSYMGSLGVNLGRIGGGMSGLGALLMAGRLMNFGGGRKEAAQGSHGGHMNFGSGKTIPLGNGSPGFAGGGMTGGAGQPGGGIGGMGADGFGGQAPEFMGSGEKPGESAGFGDFGGDMEPEEGQNLPFGMPEEDSAVSMGTESGEMDFGNNGVEDGPFGSVMDMGEDMPAGVDSFGTEMGAESMAPFGQEMGADGAAPFGQEMEDGGMGVHGQGMGSGDMELDGGGIPMEDMSGMEGYAGLSGEDRALDGVFEDMMRNVGKPGGLVRRSGACFLAVLLAAGAPAFTVLAAPDGEVLENLYEEHQYVTENPDSDEAQKLFEKEIERDGRTYRLSEIRTEVVKEEQDGDGRETLELTSSPFLKELAEKHKPEETYEKDGAVYRLFGSQLEEMAIPAHEVSVSEEVVYEAVEALDRIPSKISVSVVDEATGQEMEVTAVADRQESGEERWEDTFSFPVTFHEYGLEGYWLGDKVFTLDGDVPDFMRYEKELLRLIQAGDEDYQVESVSWDGEAYEDADGIRCRNAVAKGRKLVRDCRVSYVGSAVFPKEMGVRYVSAYVKEGGNGTGTVQYTMKAVGVYVPKKGNGAALAAVIGVTSVGAGAGVAGYAHYRKKRRIGAA